MAKKTTSATSRKAAPKVSIKAPAKGAVRTTKPKAVAIKAHTPAQDQIQARAYEIYCRRLAAGTPGDAAGDWAAAVAELSNGRA